MRINLLPPELQPTRPSPVPYMPLGGLVAISIIWVIVQVTVAVGAKNSIAVSSRAYSNVAKELTATKAVLAKLDKAQADRETLKMRAAAVTALTAEQCQFAEVLNKMAAAAPKALRLTALSVDPASGAAKLTGYGSENDADVTAAAFVRSLSSDTSLAQMFDGITLSSCQNVKRGDLTVKEFSISLKLHDRFNKAVEPAPAVNETKDKNGAKNRPKA